MSGIMDVNMTIFQMRNELMIDHFEQLIIIYNGGFARA